MFCITCKSCERDRQCTYNVTLRCVCATIDAVEKAISITYSECVFGALGTEHAMRMCHSHLWPVWLWNIFPHYIVKGTIFEKKVTKCETCVLILYRTFVWHISHPKTN